MSLVVNTYFKMISIKNFLLYHMINKKCYRLVFERQRFYTYDLMEGEISYEDEISYYLTGKQLHKYYKDLVYNLHNKKIHPEIKKHWVLYDGYDFDINIE